MNKNSLLKKISETYLFFRQCGSTLSKQNKRFKVITAFAFLAGLLLYTAIFFYNKKLVSERQFASCNLQIVDSLTVEKSLEELNRNTPIDLKYHKDVQKFIDLYLNQRRSELELMLGNSKIYFPVIEPYLDKYNLPLEIKYLAAVESGLNPLAKSKSGAIGLWQFLYSTCSLVDLEVTSYIDERRDIYKSTDAACRYLQYLHKIFNDWNLALAAYNGGPGEIKKAIERSGGKTDFWEIRAYLPQETANYVPAFIAFNYLFANQKKLDIKKTNPEYTYDNIDTILISKPLSFKQISNVLDISEEQITFLNPLYKTDYIPAIKNGCMLVLPEDKIIEFIRHESEIYDTKINSLTYTDLLKDAGSINNRKCLMYIVQEGDFCHKLAMKFNCKIEDIMAWNNLENGDLFSGQKIKIWIKN